MLAHQIGVTVAFPGPVATQIFDLAAPDSAERATRPRSTMLQKLVGKRGMKPDAGQLLFKASVAGHEWVTTDLEGLRSFLEPQRMRLDDIGAQAVGPDSPSCFDRSVWRDRVRLGKFAVEVRGGDAAVCVGPASDNDGEADRDQRL